MKKDDLTRIKYIGPSRLKRLNENGITTIEQLRHTPVRELAKINSIGEYYGIRIKEAVAAFYARQTTTGLKETVQTIKKPSQITQTQIAQTQITQTQIAQTRIAQNTRKSLKKLTKRLNSAKEKLKPLWKKKYLALYINFKKQSNKLINRIKKIEKKYDILTDEEMKEIINRSESLKQLLKAEGKKPKKKAFKNITQEIKSFSGKLKVYKT